MNLGVVANGKRAFRSPSTTVANFTFIYVQKEFGNNLQEFICHKIQPSNHYCRVGCYIVELIFSNKKFYWSTYLLVQKHDLHKSSKFHSSFFLVFDLSYINIYLELSWHFYVCLSKLNIGKMSSKMFKLTLRMLFRDSLFFLLFHLFYLDYFSSWIFANSFISVNTTGICWLQYALILVRFKMANGAWVRFASIFLNTHIYPQPRPTTEKIIAYVKFKMLHVDFESYSYLFFRKCHNRFNIRTEFDFDY